MLTVQQALISIYFFIFIILCLLEPATDFNSCHSYIFPLACWIILFPPLQVYNLSTAVKMRFVWTWSCRLERFQVSLFSNNTFWVAHCQVFFLEFLYGPTQPENAYSLKHQKNINLTDINNLMKCGKEIYSYYLLFWKIDQFPEFAGNAPVLDILRYKSHTQEKEWNFRKSLRRNLKKNINFHICIGITL